MKPIYCSFALLLAATAPALAAEPFYAQSVPYMQEHVSNLVRQKTGLEVDPKAIEITERPGSNVDIATEGSFRAPFVWSAPIAPGVTLSGDAKVSFSTFEGRGRYIKGTRFSPYLPDSALAMNPPSPAAQPLIAAALVKRNAVRADVGRSLRAEFERRRAAELHNGKVLALSPQAQAEASKLLAGAGAHFVQPAGVHRTYQNPDQLVITPKGPFKMPGAGWQNGEVSFEVKDTAGALSIGEGKLSVKPVALNTRDKVKAVYRSVAARWARAK